MSLLLTACAEAEPLPTLIPTSTPEPTQTPSPTPPATATPLPSVVELTRATDPSQQAFIRVIHAAPDLPTLDIFIERLAIGTNLDFSAFTEPSGIVAGDYFLRVVPRGVRPDAGENLLETAISFQGGDRLMLVFTGTADNIILSTFPESITPLNSGESRVTFLNIVESTSDPLTVTQATAPVVSAVNTGQPAAPVILPAGETTLSFQLGANAPIDYPAQLRERVDYTFILAGKPDAPAIIETRNQVAGRAQVRIIHAAANIGPVDVYVDGQPFITPLDYSRASDRQHLTAGSVTVDIYPRDANRAEIEPISSFPLNVDNDAILSFIILGEQSDLRLITYREDFSPTAPDRARVAFMNTLSNINRVRVDTQVGPLPEIGDLSYGQPPVAADIPLVTYTVFWNAVENGETTTQLEFASNLEFEPGRTYLYLLTGRGDDQPLIFSESIGIDEALAETAEPDPDAPAGAPEGPTQARLINAVVGNRALDLVVNEAVLASQVSYAQGSPLAEIPARDGSAQISVQIAGTDEAIASIVVPLQPDSPYTVIVYGSDSEGIQLAILPDSNLVLEGGSSHLRLLNATLSGDVRFGLAYSPAPEEVITTNLAIQPVAETFRRSMSIGMEPVIAVQDVDKTNYSPAGIAPTGIYALHILDTLDDPSTVAASIRATSLEAGGHYDIVAYQEPDSRIVQAFVVPYVTGSD